MQVEFSNFATIDQTSYIESTAQTGHNTVCHKQLQLTLFLKLMITEREYILWVLHDLAVRISPMDSRMKKTHQFGQGCVALIHGVKQNGGQGKGLKRHVVKARWSIKDRKTKQTFYKMLRCSETNHATSLNSGLFILNKTNNFLYNIVEGDR